MNIVRVLLLTALAVGCQTHAASCNSDPAILESQRVWQARHVADYRFIWQQQCFCLPDAVQPIIVTVRNGEIVSTTDLDGAAVSDHVRRNVMTLDALYHHVIDAQCDAEQIRVSGMRDGVPERIFIDPKLSVADDEFNVTISAFEVVAP